MPVSKPKTPLITVCYGSTDLRNGAYGLSRVSGKFQKGPLPNLSFSVFCNKAETEIKILVACRLKNGKDFNYMIIQEKSYNHKKVNRFSWWPESKADLKGINGFRINRLLKEKIRSYGFKV